MTALRETTRRSQSTGSDLEVEVRRYMTRAVRRYAPGAALVVLLATTIALVPPKHDTLAETSARGFTPAAGVAPGDSSALGAEPGVTAGANGQGPGTPGVTDGPDGGQTGDGGPGSAAGGVARSGVKCTGGARQVPWSRYAPSCAPVFQGDNGGTTAPGVDKDTVTISYRLGNSTSTSALQAAAGSAAGSLGGDQPQMVADLNTYIALFNKNFELYGREVVLKPYEGAGDFLQEFQGKNAAGAQADAATAKDMGAFADMSTITQTQLYAEALASQRIVSFGAIYLSQKWFDQHAPYAYSWFPTGDRIAGFMGNTACQRMAGLPAAFAGDPILQGQTRVFGIINPENAEYKHPGDVVAAKLAACGQKVAARASYALDISTMAPQLTNAMAQMNAAHVTTVLCMCDEFSPIYTTQAADNQRYRPEWFTLWWPDPWGRLASQDQWTHALSAGGATAKISQTEAYQAYLLSNPAGPPSGDYSYPLAYQQVLQLFNALQAAGPNLNPVNMANGWFRLPPSAPGGDIGPWTFGPGVYTPKSAFQLGWWSENAPSGLDGEAGSWQNCSGGTWFPYDDPGSLAPKGTQPSCFGR